MKVVDLRKEPYDIYIGRENFFYQLPESKWHSPFPLEAFHNERDLVLSLYEKYIRNGPLWDDLEELDGKILGCWCGNLPCHGDILLKLLNEKKLDAIFP